MNTLFSRTIGLIFLLLTLFTACAAPELMAKTAESLTASPQSPTSITDPALVLTPAALTAPAAGASVVDPTFGTSLRRLTDSGSSGFATHIYSQLQAFSADNQYLLLIEDEWYTVRRRDNLAIMLDASDTASWNAPRWHPTQANTIIHYDDNADTTLRLQFTDVTTGQTTTVFTFPANYERIRSNQSFDEISRDGRFLGGMASLSGGDQMLFSLNLETLTLGAELRLSADLYGGLCAPDPDWGEVEPDWIGVSPLANYLMVQWTRDGTTRCSGLESFDIATGAFVGRVYDGHQHGDLGIMADGVTEFFMTYELYHPSGLLSLGYRVLPGNATVQDPVYLRTLEWMGDHISCQGPAGVCLITTIVDPSNGWQPLEGEIFLQYLDGSVARLAHHRSSGCGYWVQPRGSLSRDGRYAIFATDWGSGICSSPVDLGAGDPYLIDLGSSSPPPDFTPEAFTFLPTVANNSAGADPVATPVSSNSPTFTQQMLSTAVQHGQHVNIVDIDQDGDNDIILSLSLDDAIYLYQNDGTGQFSLSQVAPPNSIVAMETAVTDMDNDGDLDIAAVGLFDRGPCGWGSGTFCEAPGVVVWYENPGTVTGSWTRHNVASNIWGARTLSAADLTGNGLPDLVVGSVALFGHEDGVYWLRQNANGDPWTAVFPLDEAVGDVETVLTHDVDTDGVLDIVAVDKAGGAIVWYENGRSATPETVLTFSKHTLATVPAPYGLVLANLDGDAALELLVTSGSGLMAFDRPANATNLWTATTIDPAFGTGNNARLAAADFDGDGDVDVAVSSNDAGALRWYENGSSWLGHDIATYGSSTGLAGGDLDGDGDSDLVTTTYANPAGSDRLDWWRN